MKYTKVERFEVDYYDLEKQVNEYYGLQGEGYSFVATEECGNDSEHAFSVEKKEPLSEYDQKKIDELRAKGHSPYSNHVILQDLVNNDVIPPGKYLVRVSW